MTTFLPSTYPSSRMPCVNASENASVFGGDGRDRGVRKPMRRILLCPLGRHDSRSDGHAGAQRKQRAQSIAPAHSTCEVGERWHGGIKGHCTVFRERLHKERLATRCPGGENPGYGSACASRSSRTCTSAPTTSPLMASWSS